MKVANFGRQLLAALALVSVASVCWAFAPAVQTQPPAADLIDDAAFARRMADLSASPRVHVEVLGRSNEGRPLYLIAIGAPGVIERLEEYRGRMTRLATPVFRHSSPTRSEIRELDVAKQIEGVPLPMLFVGASWGHEAAHVEGLLAAAQELAFSDSAEVREILAGTVALIVPLANPDGRASALREWSRTARSVGESGAGNAFGFILNRDFIHGVQPESRAIVAATMHWRPVGGIDFHEDMFSFGLRLSEVCFVAPFEEGMDLEEYPLTRQAITRIGKAVYARWTQAGFHALFDEHGDRHFVPRPAPGKGISQHAGAAGRLDFMWGLHGMAGVMIESARSLGTQSWDDRVREKSSAILAALQEVARNRLYYAQATYDRKLAEARASAGEFIEIPLRDQPEDGLRTLLDILTLHEIEVFSVRTPHPALLVPLSQREARAARHLLLGDKLTLNLLPASLGVRVSYSAELSQADLRRFAAARLMPPAVPEATPISPSRDVFWARPTVASTRLANRMLAVAGTVHLADGRYYFEGRRQLLSREAELLGVSLQLAGGVPHNSHELHLPRVAVYVGQGVNRADAGDVVWALREAGFPYTLLDQTSLEQRLSGVQALVVPHGSARDIVQGWDPHATGQHEPWEPAEPARGLGQAGLTRIRQFVEAGGNYIGMGTGGAYLAGEDYLRLVDVEMVPAAVGLGIVQVRPAQPVASGTCPDGDGCAANELLSGLPAASFPAFFYAPPGDLTRGLAFGRNASALLTYDGTVTRVSEGSFTSDEPFRSQSNLAAAAYGRVGRGHAVIFGISPVFRGQWRQTFQLLYNAIYLQPSQSPNTLDEKSKGSS